MNSNEYLKQVEQQQVLVDQALRRQPPAARHAPSQPCKEDSVDHEMEEAPSGLPAAGPVANYRITGFWLWKTVVVPPHMHVVHTRRGHDGPLHVGLGLSFRYNPRTDAFLVIPAAVQTLMINARCISLERQGILVQGYVQWIVDDVRTAYRKLDFSDRADPMRIVNIQLREQAEAAIKDKVATMPMDAILSDKQPIIEELTLRLRSVAEGGEGGSDSGLGLKIVTVQIKEAVVSSTRLWENLQKPFRAERERLARLAELDAQRQIAARELENRQAAETAELEYQRRLSLLRAEREREEYDRTQSEKARRDDVEQAAEREAIARRAATEKAAREAELELKLHELEVEKRRIAEELAAVQRQIDLEKAKAEQERLRAEAAAAVEDVTHKAKAAREERDVELFRRRREAENVLSEEHVRARLVERLPEIAAALPKPDELKAVSVNGDGQAAGLVGFLTGVLEALRNGKGG
jgi:flotillin